MKGSRNSVRMTNNRMVVCGLVVVLILVGLYFLAQRHNLLGVTEGFESQPAELNHLTQKPNPGPNEVVIVLFYVDWCPHCVSTKPEWAKLVEKHNNTKVNGKNVRVEACNCEGSEAEKETANDNNIQGYPTIKAIKNNETVEYSGARNAESLETFIEEQCGL
jgi:thiol-disulfide isomerase/thioredoxin